MNRFSEITFKYCENRIQDIYPFNIKQMKINLEKANYAYSMYMKQT